MITAKNETLLRAVIDAGVDLNRLDLEGNPRFLSALRWPEGLALMLEHGANTETESKNGKTALMWAVMLWHWPAVDVLLAHGAHIDHVDHEGKGLRDLVAEKLERFRVDRAEVPPPLAKLEARLRDR
jgi:ankyrin repeat protein